MTPFEYLEQTKDQRMNELFDLIRFPSVSAKSEHKGDIKACAEWMKNHLNNIGFTTSLEGDKGNPIVYGEYQSANPNAPTVLYYGHYDVQPPEPLDLWTTPPFEPAIRDGYIWARGACDDKGQTFTHIKGLESVIKATGGLPINVKFIIEGEEESHSVNLPDFIQNNKTRLKCDIVVVSDTAMFNKELPAVTYGLRGLSAVEVFVYGPDRDVHSGAFGGAISNPVNVLCWMVGQLHDPRTGKIKIPGFYDKVKPVTKWERAQFKKLPYSDAKYKKIVGVPALFGEKGYSTYERTWCRPTCDVNGITGGYQGEGAKTIIPAMASCKITMRLVPDMDPIDICNRIEKYLKKIAPKSVKVKVEKGGGARAAVVPTDGPWLEAAAKAIKVGFGKTPVFMKEGGSIPIVNDFKRVLGADTLLLGWGQNDDNIHSPNERFRVLDFERGCRTAAILPDELAKVKK